MNNQTKNKCCGTEGGERKSSEYKIGWFSVIGCIVSSVAGIIGTICAASVSVCGGVCIAGPLVAILGIGIVGFFHKYNTVFILIGGLLFLLGAFLIIQKKIKYGCKFR